MKKLIKRISLFLAAFSVLAAVSACGIGNDDSSSVSDTKESSNAATSSTSVPNDSSEGGSQDDLYSDGAELEWDWFE